MNTYQIDFVLTSNARNARVPVRRCHPIQGRRSCSESEQPPTNNEHWTIDHGHPEVPNIAPAPHIRCRLAPHFTSKLARALHRATGGPRVSVVVASRRLRNTAGARRSVGVRGEPREASPKLENMLEAISRNNTTTSKQGRSARRNGVLPFKAARRCVLDFSWCCSYSWIVCQLEVGTPVITLAVEVRCQIRDPFWNPRLKLHGASYLIFLVKPQNGVVVCLCFFCE